MKQGEGAKIIPDLKGKPYQGSLETVNLYSM